MWFTSCRVVTFVISNSQRFWCVDQLVGGCRSNMALAVLSPLVSARRSQKMLSAPAQVLRAKEVNQTGAWSQNRISISIWHTKSYNLSAISMHMQSHLQLQLFYAILRGGESQKNNLFFIETPTKIPAGAAPASNNYIKFSCILPLLTMPVPFSTILCDPMFDDDNTIYMLRHVFRSTLQAI